MLAVYMGARDRFTLILGYVLNRGSVGFPLESKGPINIGSESYSTGVLIAIFAPSGERPSSKYTLCSNPSLDWNLLLGFLILIHTSLMPVSRSCSFAEIFTVPPGVAILGTTLSTSPVASLNRTRVGEFRSIRVEEKMSFG